MPRTLQTTLCLLYLLILFTQCSENKLDVDVSGIEAEVDIVRLDSLWFDMTAVGFRKHQPQLESTYGPLYQHYVEDVLRLGKMTDSNLFSNIQRFVTDPTMAEVQQRVMRAYPDLKPVEDELRVAWQHYRYYLPDKEVPKHLSFVGGFNTPFLVTSDGIGIGLEMFLGEDCEFYDYLQIPVYLRKRMDQKHLVPWLIKGWLETEFVLNKPQPTLLDEIIHQGKVLYCLDAFFPSMGDTLKMGYSGEELQWAKDHESYVWAHFVDQQLLFSNNQNEIMKYTNDGPFTVDLVKESPSRMGYYIGWQIVRAYMEDQDFIDIQALLEEPDPQKILTLSNYNP